MKIRRFYGSATATGHYSKLTIEGVGRQLSTIDETDPGRFLPMALKISSAAGGVDRTGLSVGAKYTEFLHRAVCPSSGKCRQRLGASMGFKKQVSDINETKQGKPVRCCFCVMGESETEAKTEREAPFIIGLVVLGTQRL